VTRCQAKSLSAAKRRDFGGNHASFKNASGDQEAQKRRITGYSRLVNGRTTERRL